MAQKVFLYALSTCGHCRRTKEFLNQKQVDFDFVDVDLSHGEDRERVINEVKKHNPALTFPTLIIDGRIIVGFKEEEIRDALAET
ncbi:MAG: glutaredoxin family protein [Proteobacteria bacterium]|nr:glutaredoxin family protein [Pseudomonadota bacterium]